jgi:hypothetical protein
MYMQNFLKKKRVNGRLNDRTEKRIQPSITLVFFCFTKISLEHFINNMMNTSGYLNKNVETS